MTGRMTSRVRQQDIYEFIIDKPNVKLTMAVVAEFVGRLPGNSFGVDVAAVRHRILDEGGDLTNCAWDRTEQSYVFYYLPAKSELGQGVRGLLSASAQARTRIANNARHGEYLAKNAEAKGDRAFGRLMVTMQTATAMQWTAVERFMQDFGS